MMTTKQRNVAYTAYATMASHRALTNGVTNLTQFALDCGTSVEHITNTYYHSKIGSSEAERVDDERGTS